LPDQSAETAWYELLDDSVGAVVEVEVALTDQLDQVDGR
jgi:hypothetical protein